MVKTGAMHVLYLGASGRSDPVRAALPFHLAVNGSAEIGHTAEIILAGDATDLVLDGTLETLEPLGMPPLRDLAAKVRARGVAVHL